MPTAAFANLGCKVNQYETDKMVDSFVARGFDIADFDQPADVYVINTCSVTSAADRKSRQMARRASRLNVGAKVVLTGCFAQLALDTGESVEGSTLLVPNREKMRVAEHTLNQFPELASAAASNLEMNGTVGAHTDSRARAVAGNDSRHTESSALSVLSGAVAVFPEQAGLISVDPLIAGRRPSRLTHTRATLKVQDGCEHFCAFCSIPYTRSTMASRSIEAVLEEARHVAEAGVREIVITGVCVGAYHDLHSGAKLPDLLHAVAQTPGLSRVRLSSLQPIETDHSLIEAIASNPVLCPHLHLSLQSGDDDVLAAMQRPYDTAYYRDLARRLRARIPGIAITTDIIVGFPGETEARFEKTLRFAAEIGFSRTHVFRFSPRERTYAARNLRDDVSVEDKERRHKKLTEVSRSAQTAFAQGYVGKWADVIVEGRGRASGLMAGYTDTYVRVHLPVDARSSGRFVRARIAEVLADGDCRADSVEDI